MTRHSYSNKGFTIVELLITIVVLAILAAITVVAYNGIQERSRHAAYLSALDNYEQLLRSYKSARGFYPPTVRMQADGMTEISSTARGGTGAMACLGNPETDFSAASGLNANTCLSGSLQVRFSPNGTSTTTANYTGEIAQVSSDINTALATISTPLPSVPTLPKPVGGTSLNADISGITLTSSSFATRGIIYRSQQKADGSSQSTSLMFFNYGDFDCGRFSRWNGTVNGQKVSICASILL